MAHSGSVAFTNPNEYEASIGLLGARVGLVLTGNTDDFKVRLTWLKQRHLHLLTGRESVPRIAFVSLVPTRAFVSFPVGANRAVCGGFELRSGDIVLHSRGERTHQWTKGPAKWG